MGPSKTLWTWSRSRKMKGSSVPAYWGTIMAGVTVSQFPPSRLPSCMLSQVTRRLPRAEFG